ncbi:hypothetical protein PM082_018214 [Marasmius tenuissimus]|nr:hypothetical protein PM082_018214 [Marasmius tenuissimus]
MENLLKVCKGQCLFTLLSKDPIKRSILAQVYHKQLLLLAPIAIPQYHLCKGSKSTQKLDRAQMFNSTVFSAGNIAGILIYPSMVWDTLPRSIAFFNNDFTSYDLVDLSTCYGCCLI